MVVATCRACKSEEEIATFSRVEYARAWVKKMQPRSVRKLAVVREV